MCSRRYLDLKLAAVFNDTAQGFWLDVVSRPNLGQLLPLVEMQAAHHNAEYAGKAQALEQALFSNAPISEARLIRHSNFDRPVGYILFNHIYTPQGHGFDMEDIHVADFFRENNSGGGSYGFGKLLQIARERQCDFVEWSLTANNSGYARDFYQRKCNASLLPVVEYDLTNAGGNKLFYSDDYTISKITNVQQAQMLEKEVSLQPEICRTVLETVERPNNDAYICRDGQGKPVGLSFGNKCLSTVTDENLYGVTAPVFFTDDQAVQKVACACVIDQVPAIARECGDVDVVSFAANTDLEWERELLEEKGIRPMTLEEGNENSSFLRYRVGPEQIYGDLPEKLISDREITFFEYNPTPGENMAQFRI